MFKCPTPFPYKLLQAGMLLGQMTATLKTLLTLLFSVPIVSVKLFVCGPSKRAQDEFRPVRPLRAKCAFLRQPNKANGPLPKSV